MKYHMTLLGLALVLALLGPSGSSAAAAGIQAPPAGMGLLSGTVTRGPLSPIQGPGLVAAAPPAPEVTLVIYGPGHQEAARVRTDAAGHYRAELPPGSYLIEMAPEEGRGLTKDLPATVTVSEGQETRLDIRVDTGIR